MTTAAVSKPEGLRPALITVAPYLGLVFFLLGWLIVVPYLPTTLIPTLPEVASFLWDEITGETLAPSTVWGTFATSLLRLGIGLLVAGGIGAIVGLATGLSRPLHAAVHDFMVIGLSVPTLVWALLTGIWFGPGTTAPIVTVILAALPFVVINLAEGVRSVPPDLMEMAASFQVSRGKKIRQIVLPSLAPFAFSAGRYAMSAGWKALVIAEVFASTSGAGWTIQFWKDARQAQGVFGYAIFFVAFALLVEQVFMQRLSRRVFRWRQ